MKKLERVGINDVKVRTPHKNVTEKNYDEFA